MLYPRCRLFNDRKGRCHANGCLPFHQSIQNKRTAADSDAVTSEAPYASTWANLLISSQRWLFRTYSLFFQDAAQSFLALLRTSTCCSMNGATRRNHCLGVAEDLAYVLCEARSTEHEREKQTGKLVVAQWKRPRCQFLFKRTTASVLSPREGPPQTIRIL